MANHPTAAAPSRLGTFLPTFVQQAVPALLAAGSPQPGVAFSVAQAFLDPFVTTPRERRQEELSQLQFLQAQRVGEQSQLQLEAQRRRAEFAPELEQLGLRQERERVRQLEFGGRETRKAVLGAQARDLARVTLDNGLNEVQKALQRQLTEKDKVELMALPEGEDLSQLIQVIRHGLAARKGDTDSEEIFRDVLAGFNFELQEGFEGGLFIVDIDNDEIIIELTEDAAADALEFAGQQYAQAVKLALVRKDNEKSAIGNFMNKSISKLVSRGVPITEAHRLISAKISPPPGQPKEFPDKDIKEAGLWHGIQEIFAATGEDRDLLIDSTIRTAQSLGIEFTLGETIEDSTIQVGIDVNDQPLSSPISLELARQQIAKLPITRKMDRFTRAVSAQAQAQQARVGRGKVSIRNLPDGRTVIFSPTGEIISEFSAPIPLIEQIQDRDEFNRRLKDLIDKKFKRRIFQTLPKETRLNLINNLAQELIDEEKAEAAVAPAVTAPGAETPAPLSQQTDILLRGRQL